MKYIWNNSFLNCGNWKIGKLENLLRWLFFTFIYYRSSRMNYFIYTSHHFTPHGRYELNKLTSLLMCGFIAQLVEQRTGNGRSRVRIPLKPWLFQASSFQLLKLENLLRWSFFTFIVSYTACCSRKNKTSRQYSWLMAFTNCKVHATVTGLSFPNLKINGKLMKIP